MKRKQKSLKLDTTRQTVTHAVTHAEETNHVYVATDSFISCFEQRPGLDLPVAHIL